MVRFFRLWRGGPASRDEVRAATPTPTTEAVRGTGSATVASAAAAIEAAAAAAGATFADRAALAQATRPARWLAGARAPGAAFSCFSSAAGGARRRPATPAVVAVFFCIPTGPTSALASIVRATRAAACRDDQPRHERSFAPGTRFATDGHSAQIGGAPTSCTVLIPGRDT